MFVITKNIKHLFVAFTFAVLLGSVVTPVHACENKEASKKENVSNDGKKDAGKIGSAFNVAGSFLLATGGLYLGFLSFMTFSKLCEFTLPSSLCSSFILKVDFNRFGPSVPFNAMVFSIASGYLLKRSIS